VLVLALDACAALHAKGLPSAPPDGISGLDLLDRLLDCGAEFLITKGVYSEQVTMTLQQTLEQWNGRKKLQVVAPQSRAVRALQNQVPKKLARPGRRDIGLVCAARDAEAFVLTHDTGAAEFARAVGLVTLDVVDVALYFEQAGTLSRAAIEGVLAPMNKAGTFRPADWAGSALTTQLARPYSKSLCQQLKGALGS
jgi:hypothetical protein